MLLNSLISLALCAILLALNTILAKKMLLDREKLSPFECGFDPKSAARLPFSLRFYLIAVIFLIFDVEITLILPIPVMTQSMKLNFLMLIGIFFIMILVLGLYHEWNQGALDWDL